LFATAIARFDFLLSPSAPGEAPAGLHEHRRGPFQPVAVRIARPLRQSSRIHGNDGLPVGIQLTAARDDDRRLLRFAKWMAAHVTGNDYRVATPCPSTS
jgi:Asp-tRNA(Asn)/Glu-tRNA(Gln) amidotransferase A subunit family amidase